MNLYVGNLPKTASEDVVRQLFESHGQVSQVKLIKDNFTGELRGFGFIEMPDGTEAQAAINALNGSELEGRKLIVNEAKPKTNQPGGGRTRGGGGFHDSRPRNY